MMPEPQINELLVDEKPAALETARTWCPRTIAELEPMIRAGTEDDQARVYTKLPLGLLELRDLRYRAALTIPLINRGMPGASRVAVRL